MEHQLDGFQGLKRYSYATPLILRIFFGFFIMLHGIGKLWGAESFFGMGLGGGLEGWTGMVTSMLGLPEIFAYIVALIEFIGGIMIIIGLLTRYWATLGMIVVGTAAIFVHIPQGLKTAELPLLYFAAFTCLLLLGGGRWSIDDKITNCGKKKTTKN